MDRDENFALVLWPWAFPRELRTTTPDDDRGYQGYQGRGAIGQ
jgi:hypothetical protein